MGLLEKIKKIFLPAPNVEPPELCKECVCKWYWDHGTLAGKKTA